MKFYFEKKVIFGFSIIIAIALWLGVYAFMNNKRFAETSRLVTHTQEVLYNTEQVMGMIMTVESSHRGYVITGDKKFLQPFITISDTINNQLQNLFSVTADNINQQKRLRILKTKIHNKIEMAKANIALRDKNFEAVRDSIKTLKGKILIDDIMKIISQIQSEESKLLKIRMATNEKDFQKFTYAFEGLLSLMAVILIFLFIAIYINLKNRNESQRALQKALFEVKDLYENAPCGYHSLDASGIFVDMNQTLLNWLDYKKDEVVGKLKFTHLITPEGISVFHEKFPSFKQQGFINNLEFELIRRDGSTLPVILNSTAIVDANGKYVKSRSTVFDITERKNSENQIKLLNKELEAFTYSVSHDLRSPLRSIDGYTKILEEDYAAKLDDEGKRLMHIIMNNAKRMGQLIDDLLDFSRIGRKELIKTTYDVDKMVSLIVKELTDQTPYRKINLNIQSLHASKADIVMIRQVWENLISNALKYTSKTKDTSIEIGSFLDKNEVGYYIKDNGVGFDMAYVHKLFGVFQRLHKIQDFDGTGVGLAIVYRIIKKHGGRVWAESKTNEGATFTFTLPIE